MAHAVKCVYCGEIFDRDKEICVEVSPRRYAHATCDKQGTEDLKELEEYIKKIFCETTVNAKIKKQINDFRKEYGYTYSGILKCLKWWFEIQGNTIDKAMGGIGIVPYIYKEVEKYYYSIYIAQEKNQNKELNNQVIEVVVSPPARDEKKRLFNIEVENSD